MSNVSAVHRAHSGEPWLKVQLPGYKIALITHYERLAAVTRARDG
jgi:hypothetical protein